MTFSSANRLWILRAGMSVLALVGFFLVFAGNPPGTAASQAKADGRSPVRPDLPRPERGVGGVLERARQRRPHPQENPRPWWRRLLARA